MTTELKVGAVVLIALGILAYFIMQIEDTSFFGATDQGYQVRVRFDTISGLASDAPVRSPGFEPMAQGLPMFRSVTDGVLSH